VFRGQVRELLDALGPKAGDVAASLTGAGVAGVRQDSERCALASYLHVVLESDARVRRVKVGVAGVEITGGGWWPHRTVIAHTPAIRDFVRAFDQGIYPGLLRPAPAEAAQQA
jgi:hypothetical protein